MVYKLLLLFLFCFQLQAEKFVTVYIEKVYTPYSFNVTFGKMKIRKKLYLAGVHPTKKGTKLYKKVMKHCQKTIVTNKFKLQVLHSNNSSVQGILFSDKVEPSINAQLVSLGYLWNKPNIKYSSNFNNEAIDAMFNKNGLWKGDTTKQPWKELKSFQKKLLKSKKRRVKASNKYDKFKPIVKSSEKLLHKYERTIVRKEKLIRRYQKRLSKTPSRTYDQYGKKIENPVYKERKEEIAELGAELAAVKVKLSETKVILTQENTTARMLNLKS